MTPEKIFLCVFTGLIFDIIGFSILNRKSILKEWTYTALFFTFFGFYWLGYTIMYFVYGG